MGRLPNLSLKLPIKGAKTNWVIAYAKVIQPPTFAASLISPCISSSMRPGITGMMIPQPINQSA